jgi:uncharacterized membrane protein
MNRPSVSIAMFAAVILCSLAQATPASAAPPMYRLTELGNNLAANQSLFSTGFNNLGEIAFTLSTGSTSQAHVWRNGHMTPLSGLSNLCGPNSNSASEGMNNLGEIVVAVYNSNDTCFNNYIWHTGTVTPITGTLPPGYTEINADGLNDRAQVIGTVIAPSPDGFGTESQFVWQNGQFTLLPPLPNGNMYYPGGATAFSINDFGVIAGTSGIAPGYFQGVIWIDARIYDIGSCPGIPQSGAGSINNLGMVTGSCQNGDTWTPFVWEAGKFTILPIPPNLPQSATAGGLNDLGQIVGEQYPGNNAFGEGVALLWENGNVYDLNTLISPNDPLKPYTTLLSADTINIQGQILAAGVDSRIPNSPFPVTYLLTPVN